MSKLWDKVKNFKFCDIGLHMWYYTVVDGMSFRQCDVCGEFKNEGDE